MFEFVRYIPISYRYEIIYEHFYLFYDILINVTVHLP